MPTNDRFARPTRRDVSDRDLVPLPPRVQWWRKTRDARRRALKTFTSQARKLLTLAVSVLGATLISFGVWTIHPSAGYIVAGLLLWGVQWNYAKEEGDG